MKEIRESQQASQGINIGNSGNQGGAMPEGAKGPHYQKHVKDDKHIPNQDRSSASNRERTGRNNPPVDKFKISFSAGFNLFK